MWSEGKGADDDPGTRQYALQMNMPAYGGPNKLVPHNCSEGGVTRRADGSAFPWCCDYAVTARDAVGKMLGEATISRFGGLAVFNRALTDAEMKKLHLAAKIDALK
jgi:hypothetical protein